MISCVCGILTFTQVYFTARQGFLRFAFRFSLTTLLLRVPFKYVKEIKCELNNHYLHFSSEKKFLLKTSISVGNYFANALNITSPYFDEKQYFT